MSGQCTFFVANQDPLVAATELRHVRVPDRGCSCVPINDLTMFYFGNGFDPVWQVVSNTIYGIGGGGYTHALEQMGVPDSLRASDALRRECHDLIRTAKDGQ